MNAEVYRAALEGSLEKLRDAAWQDQRTPLGNRVLHVHVGRPILNKGRVVNIDVAFISHVLQWHKPSQCDLLLDKNANGDTPLHLAARFGHVSAVRIFLSLNYYGVVAEKNNNNDTALHEAARGGYDKVVRLLLQAHRELPYRANDSNETPHYLAAESKSVDCVHAIIGNSTYSRLPYIHPGPCGRTILHVLVQWETTEMLRMMLEYLIHEERENESLIRLQDEEGSTPLHLAAADKSKHGHLHILLTKEDTSNGSGAYIQDINGRTPLHIATLHRNWDAIKELIALHPDCIEVVDYRAQNVLHYAANWTCIKNLEYFLELENAVHLSKLMNDKDMEGNTPLHVVAANMSYITCGCINRVPNFMKGQEYAKSFNRENLTAWDIIASQQLEYRPLLKRQTNKLISSCGEIARKMRTEDPRAATTEEVLLEKHASVMKEGAQSQLVVAALVAAVSFAAAFTVPGGLNQDLASPDIGLAVLGKTTPFKIFVLSNSIALATSSLAVFFYFLCATLNKPWYLMTILPCAAFFTLFSVCAMLVAFAAGVHAVLPAPHVALIAMFYPFVFYYAFQMLFSLSFLIQLMIRGSCPGPKNSFRLSWSKLL